MLFPWIGLLAQIKLADVIVHYDDVQFSKGSFTNRVQIKNDTGMNWMTVPLNKFKFGMLIDEVATSPQDSWKKSHLALLSQSFRKSKYKNDAVNLVENVYSKPHQSIGALSRESMLALATYFDLLGEKKLVDVRSLGVEGSGSRRVLDIVKKVGGSTYITGHGASNYLDHNSFQDEGVEVRYMEYAFKPYPQQWGEFTPYVSGLDLVANMGTKGADLIEPSTVSWLQFVEPLNHA